MSATPFTPIDTGGPSGTLLTALAAVDGVNGNSFTNSGREFIEVANASGGTITITFITTATYQGYAIADKIVTQITATTYSYGPFDSGAFSGVVTVTFSSATSVTARVLKLSSTMF